MSYTGHLTEDSLVTLLQNQDRWLHSIGFIITAQRRADMTDKLRSMGLTLREIRAVRKRLKACEMHQCPL